jgi:hypothetical protein
MSFQLSVSYSPTAAQKCLGTSDTQPVMRALIHFLRSAINKNTSDIQVVNGFSLAPTQYWHACCKYFQQAQ